MGGSRGRGGTKVGVLVRLCRWGVRGRERGLDSAGSLPLPAPRRRCGERCGERPAVRLGSPRFSGGSPSRASLLLLTPFILWKSVSTSLTTWLVLLPNMMSARLGFSTCAGALRAREKRRGAAVSGDAARRRTRQPAGGGPLLQVLTSLGARFSKARLPCLERGLIILVFWGADMSWECSSTGLARFRNYWSSACVHACQEQESTRSSEPVPSRCYLCLHYDNEFRATVHGERSERSVVLAQQAARMVAGSTEGGSRQADFPLHPFAPAWLQCRLCRCIRGQGGTVIGGACHSSFSANQQHLCICPGSVPLYLWEANTDQKWSI